jgi:hypothetical protein
LRGVLRLVVVMMMKLRQLNEAQLQMMMMVQLKIRDAQLQVMMIVQLKIVMI